MPRQPSATLLLIRHGQTVDNVHKRLSGWTDGGLSELGVRQTELLAEHINTYHADLAALYSSPLERARRTAEAIARLTCHPVDFMDDLREMHFGDLDGRPFQELRDNHQSLLELDEDEHAHDFAWPNGESRDGFTQRVVRAADRIARSHPGQTVGVVTHGGVIAVLLTVSHRVSASRWRKWVSENATLTELRWDPQRHVGTLLRHGHDSHLAELKPATG
jgi:broad specificity phosphatase PhoE